MASIFSSAPARGGFSNPFTGEKSQIILLVVVAILILILIIVWIVFTVKNSNLSGTIVITAPIKLANLQSPNITPDSSLPVPKVGREFTYSLWLYLENFSQTSGKYKIIFYRGQDQTDITTANPIVFIDSITNKLYFVLKTMGSSLSATDIANGKPVDPLTGIITNNYFLTPNWSFGGTNPSTPAPNTYIILTVDYIPLQKWVNVIVAVNDYLLTTFVDGEIYSVKGLDEIKATRSVETINGNGPYTYTLMVDRTIGDLTVGPTTFNTTTIEGYISNLAFYNYALALSDVKSIYSAGPIKWNLFSYLGLGGYGVRSPVYSLNSANKCSS